MSFLVHYGQNNHFIGIRAIEEGIGKTSDRAAPDIIAYYRPALRGIGKIVQCQFNLIKKVLPQPLSLQLIVAGGVEHFLLR